MERPNTVAGLIEKRAALVKYRDQLEADIRAITCDIDHLEAAIRIFDPEDTPQARRRYASDKIKRLAGKATENPAALTTRETQELGASVLRHIEPRKGGKP